MWIVDSEKYRMKNIYLGLGANIGNRAENIIFALSLLQSSGYIYIKKISSFYKTSPVGPKQRNFYNIAVKAQTNLSPIELLILIKHVESISGRKKTIRWGPRVVDIDILFFGKEIVNIEIILGTKLNLFIPHKELQNRLFVLIPLCEIAGSFVHPILRRKVNNVLHDKSLTLRDQKVKITR
ncbi:MAG: 2-amino-4-hydroxy-6-hydroxymethyldihydropteridine diphosphokinase [Endomicrobium sp.]|jgi:2-amino-4-hydroxy-6-hydroxymethyldihydropteridine diphosphokinase|nr:2-amino-4-hydroxy-6-hydroxymethyldihydropteridine diphosphokinase [Endomicrobium sp.]